MSNTQTNHGIAGLPPVNVPALGEDDLESDAHADVAAVFEEIDDPEVLEAYLERIYAAGRKARTSAGVRSGRTCVVRDIDLDVWEKCSSSQCAPQIGDVYTSYRKAAEALGVGYNTVAVAFFRNRGNSVTTVRGVVLERI